MPRCSAASSSCAPSSSTARRTDAVDTIYMVTPLVWAQTMSKRMGGPNALGSNYNAVIEYLSARAEPHGAWSRQPDVEVLHDRWTGRGGCCSVSSPPRRSLW